MRFKLRLIIVRSFNFTTKPTLTNTDCGIEVNLVIVKRTINIHLFFQMSITHDLTNNTKKADHAVNHAVNRTNKFSVMYTHDPTQIPLHTVI